jgi:CheY-like chemotaxis protein
VHRLEAIGTLASGVAHDFNNLLTGIIGCADRALSEVDESVPACAHVEQIRGAARSGASIVKQLMSLGSKVARPSSPEHLDTVISGMEGMLRRLIGEDIEFRVTLGAPEAYLTCEPGQIEQLLMNLVVNARQAMPRGGLITVQTSEVEIKKAPARAIGSLLPGSYVRLLVSDTGCGMDEETQLHVFEPFFTTRGAGEGTGLGLPTVFGIVTQHKGAIELHSEPNKGTSFVIHLPSQHAGHHGAQPSAAATEAKALGGSETVLVVEDEPLVRGAVQHYLEKAGYRVLAAGSGAEALRLCREHSQEIQLLLTDMVLPGGMTGPEIAREARVLIPGAALVYMSAYPPERLVQRGLLAPGVESLEKPFTQEGLLTRVRHALTSQSPKATELA